MFSILRWGVVLSFLICVISLFLLVLKTLSFGRRPLFAKSRGEAKRGIFYAFGKGMMPWEKESAGKHILTYVAGILYHLGTFVALFYLSSLVIPFSLRIPIILRVLLGLSFICGIGILMKRILHVPLRKISCPDDFASNILVDMFLAFALASTFSQGFNPYFYLISILLFLYIPLGKIRHCVFFFYTRILFGFFYGKRGVLPRGNAKFEA
jgi:hypothetical protein